VLCSEENQIKRQALPTTQKSFHDLEIIFASTVNKWLPFDMREMKYYELFMESEGAKLGLPKGRQRNPTFEVKLP
jgi:predicted RNA-binding protein with PUA domain